MGSDKRLQYWKKKVRERAVRSFGTGAIADHAVGILDQLHDEPVGVIEGRTLQKVAARFEVPLKFVMRALACTMGVVRLEAAKAGPIRVVLQQDKLAKGKASVELSRRSIGQALRRQLLAADQQRCSHCEKTTSRLQIDHIIPLSMLGADEPGNWVALCKSCNREKWQHMDDGFLKLYRGRRVVAPIGARFKHGRLWPRINGTARFDTRENWPRDR